MEKEWSGGWGQGMKELPDVETVSFSNVSSSSLPFLTENTCVVCVCVSQVQIFTLLSTVPILKSVSALLT